MACVGSGGQQAGLQWLVSRITRARPPVRNGFDHALFWPHIPPCVVRLLHVTAKPGPIHRRSTGTVLVLVRAVLANCKQQTEGEPTWEGDGMVHLCLTKLPD